MADLRCKTQLVLTISVWLTSTWLGSALFADSIEQHANGVAAGSITVVAGDSDRSDWADIPAYMPDPDEDAGPEIDYTGVQIANDATNVYFRFTLFDITPETPEFFGFRHNVFLDTDRDRETGFYGGGSFLAIGADYLLQGPVLYQFTGGGPEEWSWAEVAMNPWDDSPPTDVETYVSLESLGIPPEFDFLINGANSDFATEDFYPDFSNAGELGDYFTYELGEPPANARGDFNGDGDYSCADVDPLVGDIIGGTNTSVFDLTSDGLVDQADLSSWLEIAGAAKQSSQAPFLSGDANLDSMVNAQDLNTLALNWQQSPNTWCGGDFTASGTVDAADLNELGLNWQQSSAAPIAAVPEPNLLLALVYSLIAAAGLGRRNRMQQSCLIGSTCVIVNGVHTTRSTGK